MLNDILIGTRGFLTVGALAGAGLGLTFLGRITYYTVFDVTEKAKDILGYKDTKYISWDSYIVCVIYMIPTFAAGAICTKISLRFHTATQKLHNTDRAR